MIKLDVTRRQVDPAFPENFLQRYVYPPKDGCALYRDGYYGTVAALNEGYGITFGSPALDTARRRLVVTVEHDDSEQLDIVKMAFSVWGGVTSHTEQKAQSSPPGSV